MSSAVTSVAVVDSILSVVIKAVVGTWMLSKSLPGVIEEEEYDENI